MANQMGFLNPISNPAEFQSSVIYLQRRLQYPTLFPCPNTYQGKFPLSSSTNPTIFPSLIPKQRR